MKVRVINRSKNQLPGYETIHAAGMDLRADLETPVELKPLERKLIPTGLYYLKIRRPRYVPEADWP